MTTISRKAAQRSTWTLIAFTSAAAAAGFAAAPASAAPLTVQSGSLNWDVPRETGASPQRGLTLAGYATSIGTIGGAGNVVAAAPATGASITASSLPAAGLGVTYPFQFPTTTSGAIGTYDPVAKTGSIKFAGTVTFTAHGGTFLSVVNPSIVFDAAQSARVVASGVVSAPQDAAAGTPPVPYDRTIFALDAASATTTDNGDGSYTITGLAPTPPPTVPTAFINSNTVFDSIRTFFGIERANQGFSISFAGIPAPSTPTPTATPVPTATPTPTATPAPTTPTPTATPVPTATPAPTATPVPTATPAPNPAVQSATVTGNVGNVLNLTLNATSANLGTFVPGSAANYGATITGTATSTGSALLTVQDAGVTPGFLLNGTRSLATPLGVCASTTASPACTYAPLSGTAQSILGVEPGTATPLTVGLRQSIGAGDTLAAGTYGKTLTFTLTPATP